MLAPLRHRNFRLLWAGQTVSSFGNNINGVALPFQLLALGATPLQLGIAVALHIGTGVAFLLLGGAIADRLPRRTLILASDVAGGCVAATLALLSATGLLRVEHVYVAAVALGAVGAFLQPAYRAIIADLVPPDVLLAANATRLLGRSLARIAGPTAGGLAVALSGPSLAFSIDAVTFLVSFGTLLLAHPVRRRTTPSSTPIVRDIRDGLAYVFSVRWVWMTTIYFMLVNVAYAGHSGVMAPLLVRDTLGGDARTYGAIIAAYGVGTIVASIGVAQIAARRPGLLLFAFEILAAVTFVAIGIAPILPVAILSTALTGVCLSSSTVIWQALLQRHVPAPMQGRVSSIDLLGNSVINPIAPIAAAALIGSLGPPAAFTVAGAYALVLASVGLLASPLRHLTEDGGGKPATTDPTR